ncbi:hypothetical protein [Micromonospora humidisoli]|uniref:Uncharacterized protein n=1 Tax=Micromonospora humidisoli TaxID=2807622 RepID=A0ABS2JAQ5_9ACTN|nr:hypothetical protein [Micromonospora humidisoli]MBM7083618.1 hypothetical protein [Micromonospora humidisoli]
MRPEILRLVIGLAVAGALLLAYARMVTGRFWSALAGFLALLVAVAAVAVVVTEALGVLP